MEENVKDRLYTIHRRLAADNWQLAIPVDSACCTVCRAIDRDRDRRANTRHETPWFRLGLIEIGQSVNWLRLICC